MAFQLRFNNIYRGEVEPELISSLISPLCMNSRFMCLNDRVRRGKVHCHAKASAVQFPYHSVCQVCTSHFPFLKLKNPKPGFLPSLSQFGRAKIWKRARPGFRGGRQPRMSYLSGMKKGQESGFIFHIQTTFLYCLFSAPKLAQLILEGKSLKSLRKIWKPEG